jgi:hypothetical protein
VPSAPVAAADVVTSLMAKMGGAARAREQIVFAGYEAAVDSRFRRETRPESLRGTTLFVRASNSAVAHELTLLRADLIARLDRDIGRGVLTEIRTRVGPLAPRDD